MLTQSPSRMQPWMLPETSWERLSNPGSLGRLAGNFDSISLKQMDAVALLNRTDTKFVLTSAQLPGVLANLQTDYRMLSVNGMCLNHYRTLYFDTPGFVFFNLHVNGRADRYKVRSREYLDSCLSFLEVKHKTCKDRTIKNRLSTVQPVVEIDPDAEKWLSGILPGDIRALEPKICNTFTRMTLVSKEHCERVTLDVDLAFFTPGRQVKLDGIAVAEVKLDAATIDSPFLAQMRAHKNQLRGFSKYCIGVSLLFDQVKKNNLKPKMMWIEKLTGGFVYHG